MFSASTAGGLNNRNGTAFSSLKKDAALFFNPAFGGTEEKEAPYAVAGNGAKKFAAMQGSICDNQCNLWLKDLMVILNFSHILAGNLKLCKTAW